MPGTYPAAAPTLSGDLLTIHRLLQSPEYIRRRLRDFKDLRFVSDQILTGRYRSQGGAVLFEQSEPFVTDRAVEGVNPGSEYPFAEAPLGTAAIAAIVKWGQKVRLTEEEILRNVYAGSLMDRKLQKLVNSVIKQVDSVALAAVASAVTQTTPAGTAWATIATANPFYNVQVAKSILNSLNMGYQADTVLMDDTKYAAFTANAVVTNALRRETTTSPIYTGELDVIAGLKVIVSPNLPTSDVWVLDSRQLGGMADEGSALPGYSPHEMAISVKSILQDENDAIDMQGRRKTVPLVQEPGAAVKITGT